MQHSVEQITQNITHRSQASRRRYLERMQQAGERGTNQHRLSCGNLAHAFAASPKNDKLCQHLEQQPNIGIVTAYNDMLSAHQPFEGYPGLIKLACRERKATAQVAGGVPAMCDGVTQGQPGMELSLFSRDTIAMATGVALSHNVFDAVLCLGVCDKIVPGLLIGALSFGHLPFIFVPAGPMPSGLPNAEKARVRNDFAQGKCDRTALLAAESAAYHGPGTCTFYGTANSNQMMMEVMGLHIPGAAFINPQQHLRTKLTIAAAHRACDISAKGDDPRSLAHIVSEKAIVNAMVGLLATGGSTNHTIHLVAIARAAGIFITLEDFDQLAQSVPLMTRIYPNGEADVNHFHAAGGMSFVIRQLLDAGLLHADVKTIWGDTLEDYAQEPFMQESGELTWKPAPHTSLDTAILRPVATPFADTGGLRMMSGNLGRGIMKVSAVAPEHRMVTAPARVFNSQDALMAAFNAGELNKDMVAVVRFQGPKANGMPELHKLTPLLSVLQGQGHAVALVTDGRMSGASGKIPAAIHICPEALDGGPLAKVQEGDLITVDGTNGKLEVLVDEGVWRNRDAAIPDLSANEWGVGRELFTHMRQHTSNAEQGASVLWAED